MGLAACAPVPPDVLQGYVEGEYVRVALPYAGVLDHLAVRRGDAVQVGALLFALEQGSEAAALREAAARLTRTQAQLANLKQGKRPAELSVIQAQQDQARAALAFSEQHARRQQALSQWNTQEQLDAARSTMERDQARVAELKAQADSARLAARPDEIRAAAAELEAARAALAQAQWRLTQKSAKAPLSGRVEDTFYSQGEWVPAGAPVLSLLAPAQVKVRFFVPEAMLARAQVGRRVQVTCSGCARMSMTINFVAHQPEYTPPVLYSKENRSKLVFLVEARPLPADAVRLHPGQPVDVAL